GRLRLGVARDRALCVQLGGAVGTLDALGDKRTAVRRGVAERLGLGEARAWHDHRDELLRLMAELAIVTITGGKIARDVALLSQAEVGEMLESAPTKGVGGSSAMPHQRNPLARRLSRDTDRASAQALVDDWSAIAVKERRHLKDVAVAARPSLAGQIDDVFSLDAIVGELAPVLEETLAGIAEG